MAQTYIPRLADPLIEELLAGFPAVLGAVPVLDRLAAQGVGAFSLPENPPSLNDYIALALRGGFPESVLVSSDRLRRQWLSAYVEQLITSDAEMVENGRDPIRLRRYLHVLCLNTAGVVDAKLASHG